MFIQTSVSMVTFQSFKKQRESCNMKFQPKPMEPLEKRLAACIGEIKNLICSPTTGTIKSKDNHRLLGPSSAYNQENDKDDGIDWRTILLKLYEELRKTQEKDEDHDEEGDLVDSIYTIDSIGTLITMIKDQLKAKLQLTPSDDSLIVDVNSSLTTTSDGIANYSLTLTQDNVEINEIWESLVQSLKDLLIDQLVVAEIDNQLDKETFYHEMILLDSLGESSSSSSASTATPPNRLVNQSNENDLFTIYNSIRAQRIDKQLTKELINSDNLEIIVNCIKQWVTFDLQLVDGYHLFHSQVTFHQIVTPYINLMKSLIVKRSPTSSPLNNHQPSESLQVINEKPMAIIKTINLLQQLDSFLTERDIQIPSENMSPSKDIHDIWDWRGYFISQGVDNLLLRFLNQGLNELMISTSTSSPSTTTEGTSNEQKLSKIDEKFLSPSINETDNVLSTIYSIFKFLDLFDSIELAEFKVSSKVIVNVTIIDFLLKTSEIWLAEKSLPIESYYTLYNSFLYSQRKLNNSGLANGKIDEVTQSLRCKIISSHLSLLLFSYKSLDYIVIYMKKLSITMLNLIPYEVQDDSHIFISILTLYMVHLVKIKIDLADCLIICANIIDLIQPFSVNLESLFYKSFRDIHSCCWLLMVRAAFNHAPISLLNQEFTSPSEENISNNDKLNCYDGSNKTINTKTKATGKSSQQLVKKLTNQSIASNEILSTPSSLSSSNHWSNLFDCCIEPIVQPTNAFLVSLQRKRPQWSVVIRPFLESRLSFSINIFNHIQVTTENEQKVINLLTNIITIACLNESREKSVAYLLSPIIQKNEDWRWLDITKISTKPKPWWFQSLHQVIDLTVSQFVQAVLIPITYRFLLKSSRYKSFYDEADLHERYAEYDETFLIDEASKSLLSTIPTIMETLPLPLIASLEDLKNIKLITIKTLYNSLTAQIIFGSILRCLTESKLITSTLSSNGIAFASRIAIKLESMVITEGKWPTMIKLITSIVNRRLSSKTNYVVASESDQFDLVGSLISLDPSSQLIVDNLYNFLVSNSILLNKNGHLGKDQQFNLDCISNSSAVYPSTTKTLTSSSLTYNILDHCETIKRPKVDCITDDKWLSLITRVKSKLSHLSIGQILSERDDLRHSDLNDSLVKLTGYL